MARFADLPIPVRDLRKHLKQHQRVFWLGIGVSQSAGSRYETKRRGMPNVVLAALWAKYGALMEELAAKAKMDPVSSTEAQEEPARSEIVSS